MREDYFGQGTNNATAFFSIPIHVAGGTGPNQGRFGKLGRNTFRGPAYYNFDFALIKDTHLGRRKSGAERVDLQFRGEFFNFPNHLSYTGLSTTVGSSTFGQVTGATDPRTMEFALRFSF